MSDDKFKDMITKFDAEEEERRKQRLPMSMVGRAEREARLASLYKDCTVKPQTDEDAPCICGDYRCWGRHNPGYGK